MVKRTWSQSQLDGVCPLALKSEAEYAMDLVAERKVEECTVFAMGLGPENVLACGSSLGVVTCWDLNETSVPVVGSWDARVGTIYDMAITSGPSAVVVCGGDRGVAVAPWRTCASGGGDRGQVLVAPPKPFANGATPPVADGATRARALHSYLDVRRRSDRHLSRTRRVPPCRP